MWILFTVDTCCDVDGKLNYRTCSSCSITGVDRQPYELFLAARALSKCIVGVCFNTRLEAWQVVTNKSWTCITGTILLTDQFVMWAVCKYFCKTPGFSARYIHIKIDAFRSDSFSVMCQVNYFATRIHNKLNFHGNIWLVFLFFSNDKNIKLKMLAVIFCYLIPKIRTNTKINFAHGTSVYRRKAYVRCLLHGRCNIYDIFNLAR